MKNDRLYIVVPCYNEEEMLPVSAPILLQKLKGMIADCLVADESRIVFVDDGSADGTWQYIETICAEDGHFSAVKLSKNCGHQFALLAGVEYAVAYADAVITVDADLQDDIECFDEMIRRFDAGDEIVYGVRRSRKTDSFFKRNTAQGYYRLLRLFGVNVVYNHADYRLMSKRACECLLQYKESNVFLRGIIPTIGFRSSTVEYDRFKRAAGKTKYPLKKMISLALNGITSFSVKPVRLIFTVGLIALIVSAVFAVRILIGWFMGQTVSGWASTILSIWFFGSVQLMATGIIGEYIGKTYLETKERPKYFVERTIQREEKTP